MFIKLIKILSKLFNCLLFNYRAKTTYFISCS